jgi:hypothetical protein
MDIKTTLERYRILGHYFDPEYERENEVLNNFKKNNVDLTEQQTSKLLDLLENSSDINEKYFVGDLLYLYDNFNSVLIEPLIITAINHQDPSFNRIFIQPCINNIGITIVADNLIEKFKNGTNSEKEGIKRIFYWIKQEENNDSVNRLRKLITR